MYMRKKINYAFKAEINMYEILQEDVMKIKVFMT